jgi:hypothetical protein
VEADRPSNAQSLSLHLRVSALSDPASLPVTASASLSFPWLGPEAQPPSTMASRPQDLHLLVTLVCLSPGPQSYWFAGHMG